EPGFRAWRAVYGERRDIRCIHRGAHSMDRQVAAWPRDDRVLEQWAPQHQFGAAGIERIHPQRRPYIPGGHLAEIVIAGNAVRGVDPDLLHRRAHDLLRVPGRTREIVKPRRGDRWLIGE